ATRFSELHYDNTGTDVGEAIELEGPAGTDLTGWSVVLYNGDPANRGPYDTRGLTGSIPAQCEGRGVVLLNYPTNGIQNGSPDGLALVNGAGQVVEFLSYEGSFIALGGPAEGLSSTDIVVSEPTNSPVGQSLARDAAGVWTAPAANTFDFCNSSPPPPPSNTITFSGRLPSDPPLPVGFEDQIFATLRDGAGAVVTTATFTWASEAPAVARIDANGVIHAISAGTATFRATADDVDHTTATYTLPTRIAVAGTAQYAGNAEFGEPADANASDDFVVRHDQYTASYNHTRGTPNWVSYELEASHFGPEDRCDCFTFDAALPVGFPRYTTADYTGAGAFAGFGIDRGHLARSFDRTSGSLDNANTFLFSNIVPQAADLNQGPWAVMENFLGDLSRFDDKEVYIITGVAGNNGTIKNEGKITIPAFTWKVALILPRDHGLANVNSYSDVEAVAVIMPNRPGIRNVDWQTYKTTIDAVEALSGYDLLALLADAIEIAVESNTKPPTAVADGPYESLPHLSVPMSAAESSDPDGDALNYDWSFGDGSTATGPGVSHTYATAGTFTVRLIVTDIRGLADTTFTSATILAAQQAIAAAHGLLNQLVAGQVLDATDGQWLASKLDIAAKLLNQATVTAAVNQLEGVVQRLSQTDAEASELTEAVRRLIQSLTS
ncbi:MAG TPA: DNA/RNA non-specific endonuclease, partial [Gemmatimonadales bacterium]|nr:DNA/RNA non-specific endonuclease [Gemmatimonadales bacterium]